MQISSRFTIAVHTLLCIARFSGSQKVTSAFIAGSVNVNPVVIRRTLGQLKEAGIVLVEAGVAVLRLRALRSASPCSTCTGRSIACRATCSASMPTPIRSARWDATCMRCSMARLLRRSMRSNNG